MMWLVHEDAEIQNVYGAYMMGIVEGGMQSIPAFFTLNLKPKTQNLRRVPFIYLKIELIDTAGYSSLQKLNLYR